jgi:sulfatase modifying factor 1
LRSGLACFALLFAGVPACATEPGALPAGGAWIDRTEVSVGRFRAYADAAGRRTAAEREGGGHEYAGGWQRRPGWTYARPYGDPARDDEPAVHLSWEEARGFCAAAGGRLPTAAEWRRAAFTEERAAPSDGFVAGRTYPYSSGDRPDGLWTRDAGAKRHRAVGQGRAGVNDLHDMGGNVWEWIADRRGAEALTAGGSWWYGPEQSRADAMQWKQAGFTAVYIGFRCAYDKAPGG